MSTIRTWVALIALLLMGSVHAEEPVDINTADAQAIAEAIKGVGLKRAEAIIEYREAHGPFKSVDELTRVQGIGEKILEQSRSRLTVSGAGG